MSNPLEVVHEDVSCTVCGCVCDDLSVTVRDDRIVRTERACALAEPWFLARNEPVDPGCAVQGESARIEDALAAAAEILSRARAPLIYGLSRSNTDGQRAAIALADRLGATIDTTASLCHAPSILGLQTMGESTCSLGEIRNRADLVIFWGCDPLVSHPRHMERYSVDPPGLFVPNGRRDRFVVVVDAERTASADRADLFLQVEPERDFDALWALRSMVIGKSVPTTASVGTPLTELRQMADRMAGCRCGVFFFGLGLSRQGLGHLNVAALLALVRDLHRHTRFHARRMRVQGDVTGADSVLCWQTGFPYAVNFARGYPRHNPGEFTAQETLLRGETDAVVLVGSETLPQFAAAARDRLAGLPTIVLDHAGIAPNFVPTVRFTTAIPGIHCGGTVYRMDEIPIPLRPCLSSDAPTDADVLRGIHARLTE